MCIASECQWHRMIGEFSTGGIYTIQCEKGYSLAKNLKHLISIIPEQNQVDLKIAEKYLLR